jgi:hypothetical protein
MTTNTLDLSEVAVRLERIEESMARITATLRGTLAHLGQEVFELNARVAELEG